MNEQFRSLRVAAWLGWQVESSWTNPFLFISYSIFKPIANVLIIVFMYNMITHGNIEGSLFSYIYLGNVFFIYVGAVLMGISSTIMEDREHYGMLKYIYVSPIQVYFYLLGRGMSKTLTGTIAVIITLVFGITCFGVIPNTSAFDPLLFISVFLIGLIGLAFMGILLAGIALISARHNFFIGEAVAGGLYLISGAVFPISVLPEWLQYTSRANPLTYWLEGLRRAMLGSSMNNLQTGLHNLSSTTILLVLASVTVIAILLSVLVYRLCEHIAKEKGLIDMQTMY